MSYNLLGEVEDDSEYLQGLIDEKKKTGQNTLFLKPGEYDIYKPLVVPDFFKIAGLNKSSTKIISHGDIPSIVTKGFYNQKKGSNSIAIESITFLPKEVSKSTNYTIEMVNSYNSKIENITIAAPELNQDSVFGVNFSKRSKYKGHHFINRVENSQLSNASIRMESTDSYILSNEIWGHTRKFAIHLVNSSQFVNRNQIVGSSVNGGIYIEDNINHSSIELIRITDNYFDGSYDEVNSGSGIIANNVRNSRILGNDFWRQSEEGIKLKESKSIIINNNNFTENSRRTNNLPDVYIKNCSGCLIQANTYSRSKGYSGSNHIEIIGENINSNIIKNNTILED
jgi:parallel beta-helix repeat protein